MVAGESGGVPLKVPKTVTRPTADRVRRMMLSQPSIRLNETDVARALYITKRTLARRLERDGTSYRQLREHLLAELAARHLAEPGMTTESTAAMLGYNDSAAFRKAFRRIGLRICKPSRQRAPIPHRFNHLQPSTKPTWRWKTSMTLRSMTNRISTNP